MPSYFRTAPGPALYAASASSVLPKRRVRSRSIRAASALSTGFASTWPRTTTVVSAPAIRISRTVSVVPVASEAALRNRDWVEGNLRKVTEATNGRVAYVYVPNTAGAGYTYFKRYFFPQADRDAIIVDGTSGSIYIRPSAEIESAYAERVRFRARRQAQYTALRDKPCVTKDGQKIVQGNVYDVKNNPFKEDLDKLKALEEELTLQYQNMISLL